MTEGSSLRRLVAPLLLALLNTSICILEEARGDFAATRHHRCLSDCRREGDVLTRWRSRPEATTLPWDFGNVLTVNCSGTATTAVLTSSYIVYADWLYSRP